MSDKFTIDLTVFDEPLNSNCLFKVLPDAELEKRTELEKHARYFKNEMRFDHIQYEADSHKSNCIGFLFTESAMDLCVDESKPMPTRCFGGCLFEKNHGKWKLCWIWIHPFFRNRGYLTRAWTTFDNEFGKFEVEKPLSYSMDKFLQKRK